MGGLTSYIAHLPVSAGVRTRPMGHPGTAAA